MKDIGLGIVIKGAIASSFKSSLKTTNLGLSGIDKGIKKLSHTKIKINEFQKLSKHAYKNRVQLRQLSKSLKHAGINTKNLNRDSKLLRYSLVNLKKASKIDIKINSTKDQFSKHKASILGIGAALYALKKISNSANDVLKAQGEIRSLDISKKGIDAITKAGHRMSLQFGQITAPAFIKASYDIKSGISSLSESGVKDITKMAALTAVATKASISDMTKLYALGHGIFAKDFTSDIDFGKKFSGAIAASVKAFRTDGADLSAGISNVGAAAHSMGVSLEEELAIIGLSKSAFDSASEAGSGYRGFLSGVGKAQKALGLEFVDSQGKMLPMVDILQKIKDKYGDMDLAESDELKTAFGSEEAIKIISALLPKIDELSDAQTNLKKAMDGGLSQSQQMALAMDTGYGWEKMANAASYASFTFGKVLTPVINVGAKALGGFAKGVAWVDENISWAIPTVSAVTFGLIGLVAIIKIATLSKLGLSLVTNTLRKAFLLQAAQNYLNASSFKVLSFSMLWTSAKTKVLGLWTLALAAKQKIASAATLLFNRGLMLSGLTLGAVSAKIKAYSLFTGLATAKQWLFNVALNANPIGLIVTGVAALIALGVILYKKFEPVRILFDKIGNIGKKVASFFGFGSNEDENSKKEMPSSKGFKSKKIAAAYGGENSYKKPISKMASAALITTSLAANPITTGEIKAQKALNQNNQYSISVTVNNPKSNLDITKAVEEAIKNIERKNKNRKMGDD